MFLLGMVRNARTIETVGHTQLADDGLIAAKGGGALPPRLHPQSL
jgi:hypothetical protein